jgi:protein-S-isoprenylcysteine O-methyltransferase Ste14
MASRILSVVALLVAVSGVFILVKYDYLLSNNSVTIIVQVCALALMVWARLTFGVRSFHAPANTTDGKLVERGPYRWWRHPIYASNMYLAWACVISYPFLITVVAAMLVTIGQIIRALLEEKFLFATYPAYGDYAKTTKRFIPFIL